MDELMRQMNQTEEVRKAVVGAGLEQLAHSAAEMNGSVGEPRETNATVNSSVTAMADKIEANLESVRNVSGLAFRASELMKNIASASEELRFVARILSEIGKAKGEISAIGKTSYRRLAESSRCPAGSSRPEYITSATIKSTLPCVPTIQKNNWETKKKYPKVIP